MADPAIYDLSYDINLAGTFRSPEYVSRFVIGEVFSLVRRLINVPQTLLTVRFIVKASAGAKNIILTKTIEVVTVIPGQTTTYPPDGQIVLQADLSWLLTFNFTRAESALLVGKNVFEVKVVYADGTGKVASTGYIQGATDQVGSNNPPSQIIITGNPGTVVAGTVFQLTATALDGASNVVPTPLYYFSNNNGTTVDANGLVTTISPATVIITVGSIQNRFANQITVVVT